MLRTILIIATIVVIVGAAAGGGYYWYTSRHKDTAPDETVLPVEQGLGDIPEATGIEPELGALPEGPEEQLLEAPAGEPGVLGEPSLETELPRGDAGSLEPESLAESPNARDIEAPETPTTAEGPRETRPAETTGERPAATTETPPEVEPQPTVEVAVVAEPTPTPVPPTPVPETAPTTTAPTTTAPATTAPSQTTRPTQPSRPQIAQPAPGAYSVRTLQPISQAKLTEVRKAMDALGVSLEEKKAGQYNIQAHKLALGYFRSKAEAQSWAQTNLRPKGVDFFVYQVQNMYSIQVGVFAEQQNVDKAQRALYEKFPGWRLPIRREPITISKAAYHLSITNIQQNLADSVWRKLTQMGVPAEING
jgi:hypothetical protein